MVNLPNVDFFCDDPFMGTGEATGDVLIALKERAGLSLRKIAQLAGYRGASSIQRYFSRDFNGQFLPPEVAAKLAKALAGKGRPPIQEHELTELAAYAPTPAQQIISESLAQTVVWHIAQHFGATVDRDDPDVIRLAKFLQALIKLSLTRQVSDVDDLIAGILAGLDIPARDGSSH